MTLCVYVDPQKHRFEHFDYFIEESTDGWECTHKLYHENGVSKTFDSVFEALECAEEWNREPPEEVK